MSNDRGDFIRDDVRGKAATKLYLAALPEHNWGFNWCKKRYLMKESYETTEIYQVSPLLIEIRVEVMVSLTFLRKVNKICISLLAALRSDRYGCDKNGSSRV